MWKVHLKNLGENYKKEYLAVFRGRLHWRPLSYPLSRETHLRQYVWQCFVCSFLLWPFHHPNILKKKSFLLTIWPFPLECIKLCTGDQSIRPQFLGRSLYLKLQILKNPKTYFWFVPLVLYLRNKRNLLTWPDNLFHLLPRGLCLPHSPQITLRGL